MEHHVPPVADSVIQDDVESVVPPSSASSNRLVFSNEDAVVIRALFPLMIRGELNINSKQVIERIKEKNASFLKRYTETQIVLRVRTEKRAHTRRNKRK